MRPWYRRCMDISFVPGIFLGIVLVGMITLVRGARKLRLSSQALALVFALTTVSWIGLLVAIITLTLRSLLPVV